MSECTHIHTQTLEMAFAQMALKSSRPFKTILMKMMIRVMHCECIFFSGLSVWRSVTNGDCMVEYFKNV